MSYEVIIPARAKLSIGPQSYYDGWPLMDAHKYGGVSRFGVKFWQHQMIHCWMDYGPDDRTDAHGIFGQSMSTVWCMHAYGYSLVGVAFAMWQRAKVRNLQ